MNAADRPPDAYGGFCLGGMRLALPMSSLREVVPSGQLCELPCPAACVIGGLDLRGVIVPVVDLRIKLNCEKVEYNGFTVVIVLNVRGRVVGAVVDSVSDVLELGPQDISAVPEMNATVDTSFITGIASTGERMLILMDIEALMSSADMGLMDTSSQSLQ